MANLLLKLSFFIVTMNLIINATAYFDPYVKPTKFKLDKSGKLANGQYGCTDRGGSSDVAPECASGYCCKWDKYPYGTCRSRNQGCSTKRLALADEGFFDPSQKPPILSQLPYSWSCIPNGEYGCQHDKKEVRASCCSEFCCQWNPYKYGTCQSKKTGCGSENLAIPIVY